MQKENRHLRRKLESIEGHSRRNNIVVRGLAESNGRETWQDCEQAVRNCVQKELNLDAEQVEAMSIERAHCLPRTRGQPPRSPRDVIVKMSLYKDKEAIMSQARSVRPERLYFMEDFCDGVKQARAKLKGMLTQAREIGLRSFLSFNKLVVLNEENKRNTYVYDDETDCIKPLFENFDFNAVAHHQADATVNLGDGGDRDVSSDNDK